MNKTYVIRRNAIEFPNESIKGENPTILNLDDIEESDIDKFIYQIQTTIVNWNEEIYDQNFNATLIIVDNQSLTNIMRDYMLIEKFDFHEVVDKEQTLLGGIINNFNGNVIISKLK